MLDLEKRVFINTHMSIYLCGYFPHFFIGIKTKHFLFKDMVAAPPVGFNLTFVCPDGQVKIKVSHEDFIMVIIIRCSAPIGLRPPSS